jgi:hypothetical protein
MENFLADNSVNKRNPNGKPKKITGIMLPRKIYLQ